MTAASANDRLDRDLMLLLQSLVEQLATTQGVVGRHFLDLNTRVMQERKCTDNDNDLIRALVDARQAVAGVVSQLRHCRVDLVRDMTVVREKLTGRIQA